MYNKYIKRALDIALGVLILALAWPFMALVALAICIEDPSGGPIFKQKRIGLGEKAFEIYKFRSMRVGGYRKKDDVARLLKVGAFIRKTSLDELPQIINIFKGEMSFIGPRPLYVDYLPYYTERERLRHTIRPGISGLAQVCGRNSATWEQRFEYDVEYVERICFALDLKITLMTVARVFTAKDVHLAETMPLPDFDIHRQNMNL